MKRHLPPAIAAVVDYLAANHPQPVPGFDAAIRGCAQNGFGPVPIICGLEIFYGLSHTGLKGLVASHPVWGNAAKDWDAHHEALETAILRELSSVEQNDSGGSAQ